MGFFTSLTLQCLMHPGIASDFGSTKQCFLALYNHPHPLLIQTRKVALNTVVTILQHPVQMIYMYNILLLQLTVN